MLNLMKLMNDSNRIVVEWNRQQKTVIQMSVSNAPVVSLHRFPFAKF